MEDVGASAPLSTVGEGTISRASGMARPELNFAQRLLLESVVTNIDTRNEFAHDALDVESGVNAAFDSLESVRDSVSSSHATRAPHPR